MQRIRQRGVPLLRREAFVTTAHVRVRDQCRDLQGGELAQICLTVVAGIRRDQRLSRAPLMRRRHHRYEQLVL